MKRCSVSVAVSCLIFSPLASASHMASTSLSTGSSSSINTESAVPLAAGAWSIAVRYEEQQFDRLSDESLLSLAEADPDADLHSVESVETTLFNISYGLNEDLSLGLSLPVVERQDIRAPHFHEEDNEFEIEQEGNSRGIGDTKLYGLWRFSQRENHDTSLIFGIGVPTGKHDDTSPEGEAYEQEFQPGSGSWDPLIGISHSRYFGRITLDASATYNLVGEGSQQTDLGDWITYNAGLSYLLSSNSNRDLRLVVEANGLWRDKLKQAGETERNAGGNWLNLSPGIIVGRNNWSVFANVALPIVNDPGGDQDEQDYRLQIGFQFGL